MLQKANNLTPLVELRYRANLWLQILLYCNVFLSLKWAKLYFFQLCYNYKNYYNAQGAFTICAFVLAVAVEYWRLHSGYSGNLRGRSSDLSTFIIVSPLIQVPLLLLLTFSAKSQRTFIALGTGSLLLLMLLQLLIGAWAWRTLTQHQSTLFKLRQQFNLQQQQQLEQESAAIKQTIGI